MLPAQTLDPPVNRSSPSPGRMSTVERIGGITNTEPTNEPGDEKPMKDQWVRNDRRSLNLELLFHILLSYTCIPALCTQNEGWNGKDGWVPTQWIPGSSNSL